MTNPIKWLGWIYQTWSKNETLESPFCYVQSQFWSTKISIFRGFKDPPGDDPFARWRYCHLRPSTCCNVISEAYVCVGYSIYVCLHVYNDMFLIQVVGNFDAHPRPCCEFVLVSWRNLTEVEFHLWVNLIRPLKSPRSVLLVKTEAWFSSLNHVFTC